MARFKFGWKKKINVTRVASKLIVTILGLYVGGSLLSSLALVMENQTSPFFSGLSLIGWTVTNNKITAAVVPASTGILSIVGLVAIASIIMEFVNVKMM